MIWSAIIYLDKYIYPLEDFLVNQGSWVACGYFNWSEFLCFLGYNNSKIIFLKCIVAYSFNQSKERTLKPISAMGWLLVFFTFLCLSNYFSYCKPD